MARLAAHLSGTEVGTTDQAGISGDDMEALAFAWLAFRTLSGAAWQFAGGDRRARNERAGRHLSRQSPRNTLRSKHEKDDRAGRHPDLTQRLWYLA
ncbi:hypothetical protein E05_12870 [Plautia stali symbiont]|nr:hypothetical protein E05_12870 [Plautia stali symbiont]